MRLLITFILTFWSFIVNAQLDYNPAELGRQAVESSLGKSQDTLFNQAMEDIKKSYPKEKDFTKDPEWFTSDNDLWGNTGMRSDYRGSLEENNHNVSDQTVTRVNSVSTEDNNSIIKETYTNKKKTTFLEKFFYVVAIIIAWFLLGFLINFFFYVGKPEYMIGKSKSAKNLHIIINICTIIIIIYTLFK